MADPTLYLPTPSGIIGGVVGDVTQGQFNDGTPAAVSLTRDGALLVSRDRGEYGTAAHRGGTFYSTVTTAAQAIPVITTTSGSTFCLVNPTGSTVYLEPIDFKLHFLHTNAAPITANIIGFSFVELATNAASSITKAPVPLGGSVGGMPGRLNAGLGQGYVATAITFASALTIAANWGYALFSFPASWVPTVGGYPVPVEHEFKGRIIIPPGYAMTLVASTAWGANTTVPAISWAEYMI